MALPLKVITPDMLAEDPFRLTRVDFEKDMSAAPLFALALIAVNIVVFGWELYVGALTSREAVIAAGAVYGERVFAGESWRLATGMFLHAGFSHLIGNCLVLYVLGMASEQAWGRLRALQIYFFSGLGSSLLTAFMQPKPSVGASGAIFGLMGAAIVFFFRNSPCLHPRARRIGSALLGWGLFQLGLGLLSPIVDNWGHLGGLLTGAVFGAVLPSRLFRKDCSV
jgi:rhomboid protease GluP